MNHDNKKNILLIGGSGMLGRELKEAAKNASVFGLDAPSHSELDITDYGSIMAYFSQYKPSIIINTAAEIQVDSIEKNPQQAQKVNAEGPGNLAKALKESGHECRIIHISTSDVFGQSNGFPFDEFAPAEPVNEYARTKLAGEHNVGQSAAIIRTSWLYSAYRETFVDKMVTALKQGKSVDAFGDQEGNPTWAKHLAEALIKHFVLGTAGPGMYHMVNTVPESEHCGISRYDFIREIARLMGKSEALVRTARMADVVTAPRPHHAILKNTKLSALPDWHSAIKEFLRIKYGIN